MIGGSENPVEAAKEFANDFKEVLTKNKKPID
jgi:hypothetical protein